VTVLENNVSENGVYGVGLFSSTNVSVYHNNLVNNSNQAYDDASIENRWDDGYPSGGNYWNDYTGSDYFSGPNQDKPGSDYIGDDPYVIDIDSQDNYPLVHSFETSPSLAPTNLESHLSGRDLENVTLTWNLSGDDGAGRDDIVEYLLFIGTTYHPSGFGYVPLANVTNGTSMFADAFAGEGDPDSYFYRVCAVNAQRIPSCTVGQAGKFTRPLSRGPTLVSIPLSQNNESIETVLQTVEYDNTWSYNSSSREWKWYMKYKEYRRGVWNIDHAKGMWINVTVDSNLTVAGVVPAQAAIHLHKGWNLVSFPSFLSYSVSDLKAVAPVERVEAFDSSAPPHFLRVLLDSDVFLAGQGYWVKTSEDATWVVSNA